MTRGEYSQVQARRVVTGLDENGRSTIVSDGPATTRVVADAFTINQLWRSEVVPPHVSDGSTLGDEVVIPPPPGGFVVSVTAFPPDSEWDLEARYRGSLATSGAASTFVESEIPGLHEIDSIDVITVVSGEVVVVLETTDTLLRPGDTLIQRGTRHTWRNRGEEPCVIVAFVVGARR
jgi:hypothetical protein